MADRSRAVGGRSVITAAVLWLSALLAQPLAAQTTRLVVGATGVFGDSGLDTTIDVRNGGDLPVDDVQVHIEFLGHRAGGRSLGSLLPGAATTDRVSVSPTPDAGVTGLWPIVVRVNYRDARGSAGEAIHVATVSRGMAPAPLTIGLSADDTENPRTLRVTIAGPPGTGLRLRMLSPPALLLSPDRAIIEPGTPQPVAINVGGAASMSANLPVFAIAEYDLAAESGRPPAHVVGIGSMTVVLSAASPRSITKTRWTLFLLVLVALLWITAAVWPARWRMGRYDGRPPIQAAVTAGAVLLPTLYVAAQFPLRLLLLHTTTAGGDLGSHNYAAAYARMLLATDYRLTGWVPGNYCGFPLFQMYFPAPFVLIAAVSTVLDPNVAFKLTSIIGLVALPAVSYWLLRRLHVARPGPELAASMVLLFLLQGGNSMWGGNFASTLAGEFVYSLSLLPAIWIIGRLTGGRKTRIAATAGGVALLAMTHAYTALWTALAIGIEALLRRRPWRALAARTVAFLWGGALCSFWLVPFVWYSPWTTGFKHTWIINSFTEVCPPQLWFVLAAVVALPIAVRFYSRTAWFRYIRSTRPIYAAVAAAIIAYLVSPNFSIVDVRFLPFLQLTLCLLAAAGIGHVVSRWPAPAFAIPVVFLSVALGVQANADRMASWIQWNYEGFERKAAWPVYEDLAHRLKGGPSDPRVVYEHSPENEILGTVRAFENLPLFSGRSTLEGVNLQASVTSPFIFYIQSEISAFMSCPFPEWGCSRPNLSAGLEHLRMMNVSDFIVRSEMIKTEARRLTGLHREAVVGDYELFRIEGGGQGYAVPLTRLPYATVTTDWKTEAYRWFKLANMASAVPVFVRTDTEAATIHLPPTLTAAPPALTERLEPERLRLSGLEAGRPVLIRISYHPRWRSTSGERIWLAGPGFMLVIPEHESLEIVYGESAVTLAGTLITGLSLIGLVAVLIRPRMKRCWSSLPSSVIPRWGRGVLLMLTVGAVAYSGVHGRREDADAVYRDGQRRLDRGDLEGARKAFIRARSMAPLSNTAMHSTYFDAIVLYRQERWQDAQTVFRQLLETYPEAFAAAESMYHVGLCAERLGRLDEAREALQETESHYPGTTWAGFAAERLQRLTP